MAAALSVAELRCLAKLHRARVDGAAEQLENIILLRGDELPGLLGFPVSNLRRLREHADRVGVLVSTIEAANGVVREARGRAQRESARRLAMGASRSAKRVGDNIEFDAALLGAAVGEWPGPGDIVFGDRGAIDARRLRALLKECRRLPISMLLTATSLNIKWASPSSRGDFKLWLRAVAVTDDDLMMPLPAEGTPAIAPSSWAMADVAVLAEDPPEASCVSGDDHAHSSSTEDGSSRLQDARGCVEEAPRPRETPVRAVEAPRPLPIRGPSSRSVAVRFMDALSAAMGAP